MASKNLDDVSEKLILGQQTAFLAHFRPQNLFLAALAAVYLTLYVYNLQEPVYNPQELVYNLQEWIYNQQEPVYNLQVSVKCNFLMCIFSKHLPRFVRIFFASDYPLWVAGVCCTNPNPTFFSFHVALLQEKHCRSMILAFIPVHQKHEKMSLL